ncbi:uncharacterized protein LOC123510917 isoform X2 [Portunus trituberculatus]|uniref:uncharacterized protein LOC123510917 isoform X2 n=1 Tax=Portunus trituberculatus TaxID=210409 RepID=UPI001E1CEE73|nr:uncharacterized protein LOC123510917 isoform X2 [Portunus trituberculatus]
MMDSVDRMADKVMVMVVVAAAADQDTCWDIVSISRTDLMSHRFMPCDDLENCPVKPVAVMGTADQPNECVKCDVSECDMDTSAVGCFCGSDNLINGTVGCKKTGKPKMKAVHIQTEGLFFAAFLRELQCSLVYRLLVLEQWTCVWRKRFVKTSSINNRAGVVVHVKVHNNLPHVLDYAWGERMSLCVVERQQLDIMMSWLSTLGGACSALGDHLVDFAERAGAISAKQLQIALRLGDPNMASRCRLYAAISLIQKCRFKLAASVIRQEYQRTLSVLPEARDIRLVKMCQGIWTKLRHEKKIYYQKHNSPSTRTI